MKLLTIFACLNALAAGFFVQSPTAAQTKGIAGIWQGVLDVGAVKLRIVYHVLTGADGNLTATLDSPDQDAFGLAVDSVQFGENTLRMESKKLGAVYEGQPNPAGDVIAGKFTQAGQSFPLELKRVAEAPVPQPVNRPQVPKKPYPYKEEEVTFENKSAGVKLAGTLTEPTSGGPFPTVLLIAGSGPNKRDEEVFRHPIFLVLADHLTRAGFAVLRYDKRGVGQSTGSYARATTTDFASDALAGVEFLKSRGDVEPGAIGLIGHSEGGEVAPMVAAQSKDVKFIVMMAGPGIDGGSILELQGDLILRAEGVSETKIAENHTAQDRFISAIRAAKDDTDLKQRLDKAVAEEKASLSADERKSPNAAAEIDQERKVFESPWMLQFVVLDPTVALSKVTCPVLVINGEKDLQVPPDANLPVIEKTLKESGNKDYTVKKLPGLNHLFQPCTTGSPSEYSKIETTISPDTLNLITSWLKAHTGH